MRSALERAMFAQFNCTEDECLNVNENLRICLGSEAERPLIRERGNIEWHCWRLEHSSNSNHYIDYDDDEASAHTQTVGACAPVRPSVI